MFSIKICAICYIFLNIFLEIRALVAIPKKEDCCIITAEKATRNTMNSLFKAFEVHGLRHRPKTKQFSTIHNFFASATLKDCDNHKKVARLSRVNVTDNTKTFIAQINNALNEDDKSNEEYDNSINVSAYIQKFIRKIENLQKSYMSNKNTTINTKTLMFIESHEKLVDNITESNMNTSTTYKNLNVNTLVDDDDVWRPSGRRIYKGVRTYIEMFPFMASIHFFKTFQCTGSIIDNDLVLTSSSCLQIAWNNRFFRENPAFLSVRVGCSYYDLCGESIAVLEIYFHPQYDPETLKHNIAIMRLNRKINFRRSKGRIKKIEVDKNPFAVPQTCGITVIGWGAKDHNNMVYNLETNKLSYSQLDLYLLKDCQEHYSRKYVTNRNFCAGFYSEGSGPCNRDSGGPGLCDHLLMGVVSFGAPVCGASESPTVFTKLGYYWDWIEDIMEQNTLTYRGRKTTLPPSTAFSLPVMTTTTALRLAPFDFGKPKVENETAALRIIKEDDFQDFLSTIFESKELKNLDTEIKNETKVRHEVKVQKKGKDKSHKKVHHKKKHKTVGVIRESIKAVTVLGNARNREKVDKKRKSIEIDNNNDDVTEDTDRASIISDKEIEAEVMALLEKLDIETYNDTSKYTEVQNKQTEINDTKVEDKDINDLIDNLDMDVMFRSVLPSEGDGNNTTIKENEESQDKLVPSIKHGGGANTMDNVMKNESIISLKEESSQDSEDESSESEDQGMSIEGEPTTAVSPSSSTKSTNTTAPSFPGIAEAVDEIVKKINSMKHYLI